MGGYIMKNGGSCGSGKQPPATVKQMAPLPAPMNPKHVEEMMRQMSASQVPPMSSSDGVSITISIDPNGGQAAHNYVDSYSQQGQEFSRSELGKALFQPYEEGFSEDHKPIRKRASDILSNHLGFRNPEEVGMEGFYEPGSGRLYRR